MAEPPEYPAPASVYVHTMKKLDGLTEGLSTVLPAIIRDGRELQAAAIMCSASNVRGHFFRASMALTSDHGFIEILAKRVVGGVEKTASKLYVELATVTGVSKDLPAQYGIEAVGNPMCGSRVSIKASDRIVVVYCTTAEATDAWFGFLEKLTQKRNDAVLARRMAGPEVDADPLRLLNAEAAARAGDDDAAAKQAPARDETSAVSDMDRAIARVDAQFARDQRARPTDAAWTSQQSHSESSGRRGQRQPRGVEDFGPLSYDRFVDTEQSTVTNRAGLSFAVPGTPGAAPEALDADEHAGFAGAAAASRVAERTSREQRHGVRHYDAFAQWRRAGVAAGDASDASDTDDDADGTRIARAHNSYEPQAADLAQFALPPLALDEAPAPDQAHLDWRFGAEMLTLWPEAAAEQLEFIRQQQTLRVPGRWCEGGQCDPNDADDADGDANAAALSPPSGAESDPVVAARKALLARSGGSARVATANEILNKKHVEEQKRKSAARAAEQSASAFGPRLGRSAQSDFAYDASPLPWVAFPWRGSEDAHLQLLWRLAKLRVAVDAADEAPHRGLPHDVTAGDVPRFWKAEYDAVRGMVGDRKASIRDRLGVKRVGRGYRYERSQHEASSQLLNEYMAAAAVSSSQPAAASPTSR